MVTLREASTRLMMNLELLEAAPEENRSASELPAGPAPVCTSTGTAGGEDRSLPAQGPQGGEEEPSAASWARDTQVTSPHHLGPSL